MPVELAVCRKPAFVINSFVAHGETNRFDDTRVNVTFEDGTEQLFKAHHAFPHKTRLVVDEEVMSADLLNVVSGAIYKQQWQRQSLFKETGLPIEQAYINTSDYRKALGFETEDLRHIEVGSYLFLYLAEVTPTDLPIDTDLLLETNIELGPVADVELLIEPATG